MFINLLIKDLHHEILSLRFLITAVVIMLLFIASGFFFISNYQHELQQYQEDASAMRQDYFERTNKQICYLGKESQILLMKPLVQGFLAYGNSAFLPNAIKTDLFLNQDIFHLRNINRFLPHASFLDWTFIVGFVLSFLVVVLTFNSVTGEKEAGTLRLILSHSIPRYQFILAKYFNAAILILLPFFIGLNLNLIIIHLDPFIQLSLDNWAQIAITILLSILFLSCFIFLGLLVSSRVKNSATSLVILLLIWVILAVIVPRGGLGLAIQLFQNIPTQDKIENQIEHARQNIWNRYDFAGKLHWGDARDPIWGPWTAKNMNVQNEATLVEKNLRDQYTQAKINAIIRLRAITMISPVVAFECSIEKITGTGLTRMQNFLTQVDQYRELVKDFIRTEDAKDPTSPHLYFYPEGGMSFNEIEEKDFPRFEEQSISLVEGLLNAKWCILVLLLFNLLFLVGAHVSFLSYDVR